MYYRMSHYEFSLQELFSRFYPRQSSVLKMWLTTIKNEGKLLSSFHFFVAIRWLVYQTLLVDVLPTIRLLFLFTSGPQEKERHIGYVRGGILSCDYQHTIGKSCSFFTLSRLNDLMATTLWWFPSVILTWKEHTRERERLKDTFGL